MKHTPGFEAIVNQSRAKIRETNADEVHARLERGDKLHLVDVREDGEWAKGHLPGAQHIGKGVIERDIETKIPDQNAEIVLYCGGGYRSALAADVLGQMGYTHVWSMDGGWRAWTEAGYPVEKDSGG